jgi:pimeloyl-ACP methyl ester carboxylesterase
MIFAEAPEVRGLRSPLEKQKDTKIRDVFRFMIRRDRIMLNNMRLGFAGVHAQEQNMDVAIDTSEFSYLPAQAEALGVELPRAERLNLELPDGRMLSALRYGAGEPEVTLLHGAGLNAHTWDTTALALRRPLLAIDLAGHGDSSWRSDARYLARPLAADVAVALERWTARPQLVVGQSLGGLTAAALAASRPDLVSAVIVIDITPGIDVSAGPAALRAFYEGPTDFATRDELVDKAMSLGFGGTRPETERGVFLNTRVRPDGRVEWKHHFAHLAAQALAAHEPGPAASPSALHETGWEDLAAVTAPLTLVRATRGFVSETDAAEFARRLPDARVISVEATHNVQETAPAELAALIDAAL